MASEIASLGNDPYSFLANGGEMEALMRAKDWSSTPLGPLDSWPQSLRTAVSVMLTSPEISYILWGPEFAVLYNDLGRPIVAHQHPACLGLSCRDVLTEAWPTVGPIAEGVVKTGTAAYLRNLPVPLNRSGVVLDHYFTFSYLPVRIESGEVGGVLTMPHDTTVQVLGARRMTLMREQSLRAAVCTSVADVLLATEAALGQSPDDLPFALLYGLHGDRAKLVGCAGVERGTEAAPLEVNVDLDAKTSATWPLAECIRSRAEVVLGDLQSRFGALPGGASGEPAQRAILVPLITDKAGAVEYVLIAGLNPRHVYDTDLNGFLLLLGRQIAASITSTRALEEKTLRAAQLAELDRQKTEFFSNVSHEFRTPLTLMLGPLSDALEHDGQLHGDALAAVHRNSLRLLKLVNNLLDFARVEAGRARAAFQPTDLAALTLDLASGFRSAIEDAGLQFEVACARSPEPVYVDRDMWEKIVLNLLSNALKFTFTGTISVKLEQDSARAVLSVSDTGVGIAEHNVPRLFERFHRIRGTRSRTHEGSGIGLALVADLARLHSGSVVVRSRVDEGTTFTVTIPRGSADLAAKADESFLERTATDAAAYTEEAMRWRPTTAAGSAKAPPNAARILIVDDNADMRDYLTRLLSERWQVEAVADGTQALTRAAANPPDAIVSDMMMPGLDGMGLLKGLRSDDRTREIPFIMLSARADEQATADALACGASDFMLKPFSARELLARVGAQLDVAVVQRAARRRLESFLLEMPAAVAILRGLPLKFVLANEYYERLVGRTGLVGTAVRDALPELTAQGIWNTIERVYETGEPFVAEAFAATLSRGDGGATEEGFFNWVAQPTYGADSSIDGVMIFAVDVTEQVRAHRQLEEARRIEHQLRADAEAASVRAETANRAKDEFLAMLGHELRNPIAPISTALELMRQRGDQGVARERRVIERQVSHLEGLVNDLLDVSRIAQGKIDLHRSNMEVSAVLAEATEMVSPLFERKSHHLRVVVPATGLIVNCDRVRLRQVFTNLLANAAKYTEPHGKIVVEASRRDEHVVIRVSDNGSGISTEMMPRIFTLFSQAAQSLARSEGGLGLGLAIVRNIVEMHDGRVYAHSAGAGQGSTFFVELPAASPSATVAASQAPASLKHAIPPTNGRRILLVDDNEDAAELLSEVLISQGNETQVAFDGPSALQLAKTFQPTVALLDIGLPVMDGYELARLLRSEPTLGDLKLIAITGYGQQEDMRRSKEAGFDAHLVKPVRLDKLAEVLGV